VSRARRLWLVRHPRPLVEPGICYGVSDLPADPLDTVRAAQALAGALPARCRLFVSALRRAQQLAQAVQALRPELPVARVEPRLNEIDFGCWEMQAWDGIERSAFDAWTADFARHRFGGRESVAELLQRVEAALAQALVPGPGEEGVADLVWITHAGVIRALAHLQACPDRLPATAGHWPREAPAFGQWRIVDLDQCFPLLPRVFL